MSDKAQLRRAEATAETRLNEAVRANFLELRESGVGGRALFEQVEERVQPLREEYEQAKFERLFGERDRSVFRQGTFRGIALVVTVLLFVWMARTITEAMGNEDGGMVPIVEEGREEAEIVGEA